ncbi:MAG: hypothetical protein VX438_02700 [Planctomycetota bacterium]|jgi:predicted Zn-dependent protease|nr:hypothetical protein [Planctomycetota bacterium]
MSKRIERIESMLLDSPNDVFLRYSLAMELRKDGESDRCQKLFQELIEDDPPHVPAFLMFAQYYAENDKPNEASEILRCGIQVATRQNESHAASEMEGLLAAIGNGAA